MAIELEVNGQIQSVDAPPGTPLLYVLRNDLGLSGPKFGCGRSQCGACTVLVDGKPMRSCVRPVSQMAGRSITTLSGLGTPEFPHPVQTAFLDEQALQCGYCANGMIMAAAALLAETPSPSGSQVREALDGNLCRCGAHDRIVRAVLRASEAKTGAGS